MIWERTDKLLEMIRDRKNRGNYPLKESRKDLRELGKIALEEGAFYDALNAYLELEDRMMIRIVGEKCLTKGWLHDAVTAFQFLGEREGIFRVIKDAERINEREYLKFALKEYVSSQTRELIKQNFNSWASERGFDDAVSFDIASTANMAHRLVKNYDYGVGVAKGGLFLTYMFNLFGLETKLVECHRKSKGAVLTAKENVNLEEINGKKIVVFDKDVVSGRTTRKVLEKIQKYNPEYTDLVLIHNPVPPYTCGIGTVESNIPASFNNVYYPNKFNYQSFDKVIEQLEEKLGELPDDR